MMVWGQGWEQSFDLAMNWVRIQSQTQLRYMEAVLHQSDRTRKKSKFQNEPLVSDVRKSECSTSLGKDHFLPQTCQVCEAEKIKLFPALLPQGFTCLWKRNSSLGNRGEITGEGGRFWRMLQSLNRVTTAPMHRHEGTEDMSTGKLCVNVHNIVRKHQELGHPPSGR